MLLKNALFLAVALLTSPFIHAQRTIDTPALKQQLAIILARDQGIRQHDDSVEYWHAVDSANQVQVVAIIEKYGWPGRDFVGEQGNDAVFYVIQHADVEFPSLKDVKLRDLPKNEQDWVLVYAFYTSDYGTNEFTREMILEQYKVTARLTANRRNNLFNNIKRLSKAQFIKASNDTNYIVLPKGKEKIIEILSGNSSSNVPKAIGKRETSKNDNEKKPSTKGSSPKVHTSSQTYKLVGDLDLLPKGKKGLKEFYTTLKASGNYEYYLIIIYYLERVLGISDIGADHIYTCFKHLNLKVPNIIKGLHDLKRRKGWVNTSNMADVKVTISGENHLEHELQITN